MARRRPEDFRAAVMIVEIKTGEFAGYYGVFVGPDCHVYTPAWHDAVAERDRIARTMDYAD